MTVFGRRMLLALLPTVLSAALPAAATELEIPLPGILGTYPDGQVVERRAGFDLGGNPGTIRGAWLKFTGTVAAAYLECEDGGTSPWGMEFSAMLPDETTGAQWVAWEPVETNAGIFAYAWKFVADTNPTATWGFLADGRGELVFYGGPLALVGTCWPATPAPAAVIDEAMLVLEIGASLPVEATTWGSVKALFGGRR